MKTKGRFGQAGRGTAALVALLALAGCSYVPDAVNPVEWYRDLSGASKNDDQTGARNADNLAAGSKEAYPTLGSVPNPPTRALTTLDRDKLQKSLAADRDNAKYTDEEVRAYRPASVALSDPAPSQAASTRTASLTTRTATQPSSPAPEAAAPPSPPAPAMPAPRAPSAQASLAPQESTLAAPAVRNVPQGDEARPAPAAPTLASTPGAPKSGRLVDAGNVVFNDGSSALNDAGQNVVLHVAGQQKRSGGTVRIVGYARRGPDAGDQDAAGFRLALDRANAVAQALAEAGVAIKDLAVEAAPVQTADVSRTAQRTEIYLEY